LTTNNTIPVGTMKMAKLSNIALIITTFPKLKYLLLSLPFLIYFIVSVGHLGFVRDDWAHYASMINLRETGSFFQNIDNIITNLSTSPTQPRIFFGSFLVHYIISFSGNAAPLLIYSYQTLLFLGSCSIAGLIIFSLTGRFLLSYLFSIILLLSPLTSQPSLWINNLFFVQPLFLGITLFYYIIKLRSSVISWTNAFIITLLSIASISSGEIILFSIFIGLLLFTISFSRSGQWGKVITPLVVSSSFVAFYTNKVMLGRQSSPIVFKRIFDFPAYLREFWHQSKLLAYYNSDLYGKGGGIHPTFTSAFVTLISLLLLLLIVYLCTADTTIESIVGSGLGLSQQSRLKKNDYILVMMAFYLSSYIPMIIGLLNGSRSGPDLRYQYVPGFLLIMLIALILDKIAGNSQIVGKYLYALLFLAVSYISALAYHNIINVWGSQRKLDDNIWLKIDREIKTSNVDYIITYHPDHQYLMAPYNSNAISDFQADWGISGRIAFKGLTRTPVALYRDAYVGKSGQLKLRNYYDNRNATCIYTNNSIANVLYVSFDYPSSFSAMLSTPVFVTRDYHKFLNYKNNHYGLSSIRDLNLLKALSCSR